MASDSEPVRDVAHIGSVELLTPRPERSLEYFRDVLGMEVVHRDGRSVYLRGYGDYAASTLKLSAAADAGVGVIPPMLPALRWQASQASALATSRYVPRTPSSHRSSSRLIPACA